MEKNSFENETGANVIECPEDQSIKVLDWNEAGFTPQQKQDWINVGLSEDEADFARWLRDTKRMDAEKVLNQGNEQELREEYAKSPKQIKEPTLNQEQKRELEEYRKSLKELGQSNNPEEFLNSDYREIYEKEAEELERLEEEKGSLETDQTQTSYDLMRPDLAILWRKQLYFVVNFKYSNNYKLTVQIRAKKCPLSIYYWNWQRSQGKGVLEQGPVIKEDNPNPDGTPKNLMQSARMHYEFCSNLGIKRIYQSEFSSYQPRFSLFRAFGKGKRGVEDEINRNPSWATKKIRGETTDADMETEGDIKGLAIPTDIHLTKLATRQEIMEALKTGPVGNVFKLLIKLIKGKTITKKTDIKDGSGTITEQEEYNEAIDPRAEFKQLLNDVLGGKIFLTIGPEEHDGGGAFFSTMKSYKEVLFKENAGTEKEQKVARTYKNWLKKQPHLWDHTTFQFYLFNDITMSANGQHLGIKYDKDKNDFVLSYKLFINHAPGVLVYRWEFHKILSLNMLTKIYNIILC